MDLDAFRKLLLDPERLAVVGAVATTPRSVDDIVAVTEVDRRTVLETIGAMAAAGVLLDGDLHQLDATALRQLAGRRPQPAAPDATVFHGMTAAEGEILARFFEAGRLVEIPRARRKRQVVLERLALEFAPGQRYPEAEVNEVLERFHPDYAALRRHLVDEGLMDRADNVYWRSGGRVLV